MTSSTPLPPLLVDGFMRLCQGDFSYRLARTMKRDDGDTTAFFFNSIAEELERILAELQQQRERLAAFTEQISDVLTRVVSGEFTAEVTRTYEGDSVDVVAFLINNTIAELAAHVSELEQRNREERARLETLVAERAAQLEILATTDDLTGCLNRRRFFEVAEEERARALRYEHPLVFAMADLDHFKLLNDTYGHVAGDEALRRVAAELRRELRTVDRICRYGGEEFGILLPESTLDQGKSVLSRIRESISALCLRFDGTQAPLTVSIGAASLYGDESIDDLVKRADARLYSAKAGGRNSVCIG